MKDFILFFAFISFCFTSGCTPKGSPVDIIPEYGGMDRSAIPELKAGDEWLIESTTREFGGREKASKAFSEQGMRFYFADDLSSAMKRFNQAWLRP